MHVQSLRRSAFTVHVVRRRDARLKAPAPLHGSRRYAVLALVTLGKLSSMPQQQLSLQFWHWTHEQRSMLSNNNEDQ